MMPGFGWGSCCGFGNFGSSGWIGWIINIVLTVGILIGIVLLVIWAVRRLTNGQSGPYLSSRQAESGMAAAREILQTRYARGEISREEYRQMLEDIREWIGNAWIGVCEMMGFGMGFGGIGLLIMLLFWGGLIFLGVWLVKTLFVGNTNNRPNNYQDNNPTALEILAQRYARGEITREQYEAMKQDLRWAKNGISDNDVWPGQQNAQATHHSS